MPTTAKARDGTQNNGSKPPRSEGLKANYGGATPKEVARAFYWHRRKPQQPRPARNQSSDH